MSRRENRIRCQAVLHDEKGSTIVEFALVAPVLSLLMLGAFDVAHTLYTRATLQGIVQKTARDSTLESGTESAQQAALDEKVRKQVRALANNADVVISRRYYKTFTEAAVKRYETFTDTNANGTCDGSEPYEDANNNNVWDADGANSGQGGAKDATLYTVTMSYRRFFPLYNVVGGSNTTRISASTVLRNQPYGDQAVYSSPVVRNCPAPIVAPTPTPTPGVTPTPTPTPAPGCVLNVLGVCVSL